MTAETETRLKRWIRLWNAYWFPETSTLPLSISRIILVATQLFVVFPSLKQHQNLVEKNSEFINPQLLISGIAAIIPREVFFTPSTFAVLYWITLVAGVCALVGFFTRTSLFVLALGIWVFVAHLYSYGDKHHPEAVFVIVLLALAFAPSGASLSVDALLRRRSPARSGVPERVDNAMWPLKLAHVLLALTYLSTGMSKLIVGGPAWMNGYTLQQYMFADAVHREIPLGMWLAQQHTLAIAMSIFTILLETFFFVSLFVPWTAPFIFLCALGFQIGLYVTAGHKFFQHIALLIVLLLFINPGWWRTWLTRLRPHSSRTVAAQAH